MSIDTGEPRSEWIGPAPSPGAFAAVLLIGTIGMLICGVQPVLLGALVAEGRLSTAALGWATTAEFLALGFGIFVAGAVLKPRRLRLLVVAQPTRGVDIGAIEFIHRRIIEMRDAGKAILLVSVELDEIRSLSDRIMVMFAGRVVGEKTAEAEEQTLGLMMAGIAA